MTRWHQSALLALGILVFIVTVLALAQMGATTRCALQFPKWVGCVLASHENLAGGLIGAGGTVLAGWIAWIAVHKELTFTAESAATERRLQAQGLALLLHAELIAFEGQLAQSNVSLYRAEISPPELIIRFLDRLYLLGPAGGAILLMIGALEANKRTGMPSVIADVLDDDDGDERLKLRDERIEIARKCCSEAVVELNKLIQTSPKGIPPSSPSPSATSARTGAASCSPVGVGLGRQASACRFWKSQDLRGIIRMWAGNRVASCLGEMRSRNRVRCKMGDKEIGTLIETKKSQESRSFAYNMYFLGSVIGTLILLVVLFIANFESRGKLTIVYFIYAFLAIVTIHFGLFGLNWDLAHSGSRHRKRLVKYVEYGYAAIISISFLQIFFALPRIADHVLSEADEPKLLARIQAGARQHVAHDCQTPDEVYFTVKFCQAMREIADSTDVKSLLVAAENKVWFLSHRIGYDRDVPRFRSGAPRPKDIDEPELVFPRYSPIVRDIERVRVRTIYLQDSASSHASTFAWIAILLLPIGIGLRIAKTSLELFGNLDEPPIPPPPEKLNSDLRRKP
jgi:hypothetical protein